MKFIRLSAFALSLTMAAAMLPQRASATDREISGELVILKGTTRQFRIVDQAGSFTAPAGISLEEFDGKPVRVELSGSRVVSITEKPIQTDPMMRNYQIVTGQLVVGNSAAGSFTISGDGRTFVAPPGFDVRPYANQMVDVFLDERGDVKSIDRAKNSAYPNEYAPAPSGYVPPATGYVPPPAQPAYVPAAPPTGTCAYNGLAYSDGEILCQSGSRFRCDTGVWRDLGGACPADVPAVATRQRSCLVGDATVGSGSTICRAGVTYRCNDGSWNDAGTACR